MYATHLVCGWVALYREGFYFRGQHADGVVNVWMALEGNDVASGRVEMITRRGFFGLMGGFAAAEVARKIYVLPPMGGWRFAGGTISPGEALFYLPSDGWTYRYTYRNIVTGHVSDATPEFARLVHTFVYPDMDVVDIYRQMRDGSFDYRETVGVWGTKG